MNHRCFYRCFDLCLSAHQPVPSFLSWSSPLCWSFPLRAKIELVKLIYYPDPMPVVSSAWPPWRWDRSDNFLSIVGVTWCNAGDKLVFLTWVLCGPRKFFSSFTLPYVNHSFLLSFCCLAEFFQLTAIVCCMLSFCQSASLHGIKVTVYVCDYVSMTGDVWRSASWLMSAVTRDFGLRATWLLRALFPDFWTGLVACASSGTVALQEYFSHWKLSISCSPRHSKFRRFTDLHRSRGTSHSWSWENYEMYKVQGKVLQLKMYEAS